MCQIKPRLTKNQFHKNKYCLCRRMTRHTQIPDTYELFLDFLKTSINNQNKICLSDSQIVYTQIVKAIISIWNQLIVAQFKLDASKLNSSLTELGPAQPQLVSPIAALVLVESTQLWVFFFHRFGIYFKIIVEGGGYQILGNFFS